MLLMTLLYGTSFWRAAVVSQSALDVPGLRSLRFWRKLWYSVLTVSAFSASLEAGHHPRSFLAENRNRTR